MTEELKQVFDSAAEYVTTQLSFILLGLLLWGLCVAFRGKVAKFVSNLLKKSTVRWPAMSEGLSQSVISPLRVYLPVFGLYLFLVVMNPGSTLSWAADFSTKLIRISNIVLVTWIAMNLSPYLTSLLIKTSEEHHQTSAVAIKFTANVLKIIIVSLSLVIIISELGYNINGIITGLGIGGLTMSLAAKNTASNLFAGFEIVADKPFEIGDYIETPSCKGTVEDMTMRSTRIRTTGDLLVVIPNSTLMAEAITNYSKMGKRLVNESIGLTYDTSNETIEKIVTEIREMLSKHEAVDNERIAVSFSTFGDSSLNIEYLYFTIFTDKDEHMLIKQDVNLKIRAIVEKNGASFAFPSTSVYLENAN